MNNILIIGAGQLGSRHLQGTLLSKNELSITVVDPSHKSLNIAKDRAAQVEYGNANSVVSYTTCMPNHESIDVCIIATAAQVRAMVTKQLLLTNQVKHIIFEKVLFQKLVEYTEISQLLSDSKTVGWVNCPRRLFPSYKALKLRLDLSKPVHMAVRGNAWGMACNSVHFLDVFSYLVNNSSLELTESNLDSELINSKRAGFYETTGQLSFTAGDHSLIIESGKSNKPELILFLENAGSKHVINEGEGTWVEVVGNFKEQNIHSPIFQSQLTGVNVDDLLISNLCELTPFSQSCELHIPFITALIEHMSTVLDENLDACPIT
ncbi:MAG: Gfo/Idh/MocA family oxidoreductase [Cocleimonas sp.]